MVEVLLVLDMDDDDGLVYRTVQLPISPFPGMLLMVGESAAWNQLRIDEVIVQFVETPAVECWVSFCDGDYDRKFMESKGWESSR
jgi:hypothetical protein